MVRLMVRRYATGATAVAAVAAVAVSLTGCDDSGRAGGAPATNVSAAQAVTMASQKTTSLRTFKGDITSSGTLDGRGFRLRGRYQYRLKPQPAMSVHLPEVTLDGRSVGDTRQVLLGDTVYVKLPSMLSQLTNGKPWMKFSLSKLDGRLGGSLQRQTDPQALVKMLTATKDARKVGTETIDGVPTTHYTGSLTRQEALRKLDAQQRRQADEALGGRGVDRMYFDLWTDAKQEPRKVTLKPASGAGPQLTTTMTFTDFNKAVHISAPPANEVTDGSALTHGDARPGVPG